LKVRKVKKKLFHFFLTLLFDPDREVEREAEERVGEERETVAREGLLKDRIEEEPLDGDTLLGEYELRLDEEDWILE
jgi:hypothetical protein